MPHIIASSLEAIHRISILYHGTEFKELKHFSILTNPFLPVKYCPLRIELDKECDEGQQQKHRYAQYCRASNIREAFDEFKRSFVELRKVFQKPCFCNKRSRYFSHDSFVKFGKIKNGDSEWKHFIEHFYQFFVLEHGRLYHNQIDGVVPDKFFEYPVPRFIFEFRFVQQKFCPISERRFFVEHVGE